MILEFVVRDDPMACALTINKMLHETHRGHNEIDLRRYIKDRSILDSGDELLGDARRLFALRPSA